MTTTTLGELRATAVAEMDLESAREEKAALDRRIEQAYRWIGENRDSIAPRIVVLTQTDLRYAVEDLSALGFFYQTLLLLAAVELPDVVQRIRARDQKE